jgi:hypothetical protein
MNRSVLILAAVLVALPAQGQVPDYDPVRYCTEFAKSDSHVEHECRRDEAHARRKLEENQSPPEIWAYCKDLMQSEQSYSLLYGCINAKAYQRREKPSDAGQ